MPSISFIREEISKNMNLYVLVIIVEMCVILVLDKLFWNVASVMFCQIKAKFVFVESACNIDNPFKVHYPSHMLR